MKKAIARCARLRALAVVGLLANTLAVGCLPPSVLRAAEPARGQAALSVPGEPLVPSRLPPGEQWKLVWGDEFNGPELDRTKWDFRLHMMHRRHKT